MGKVDEAVQKDICCLQIEAGEAIDNNLRGSMNTTKQPEQMSTTRKIEGWTDPEFQMTPGNMSASVTIRANALPGDAPIMAIIGGKGYTQQEVMALVHDLYSAAMDGPYIPNLKRMEECLVKHGIKL